MRDQEEGGQAFDADQQQDDGHRRQAQAEQGQCEGERVLGAVPVVVECGGDHLQACENWSAGRELFNNKLVKVKKLTSTNFTKSVGLHH